MKHLLKRWTSVGAAMALLIGASYAILPAAAHAADMLDGEGETLVEFGTGWYLRGDIGGGTTSASAGSNIVDGELDLGNPISLSVGAGYNVGNGLRYEFGFTQLTNLSFSGRTSIGCGREEDPADSANTIPITGNCFQSISGDVVTSSGTVSAFKDFQKIGKFTPYIGIGGGLSYVSSNELSSLIGCNGRSDTDCGAEGGFGANVFSEGGFVNESSFTYTGNVILGASYDLSNNMKVYVGYKYSYYGSATLASTTENDFISEDLELDSFDNHEIRVGLRYEIW